MKTEPSLLRYHHHKGPALGRLVSLKESGETEEPEPSWSLKLQGTRWYRSCGDWGRRKKEKEPKERRDREGKEDARTQIEEERERRGGPDRRQRGDR